MIKGLQLGGLASPVYTGPALDLSNFDRAQVSPYVGALCIIFMSRVVPQLNSLGQRKASHRDIAARAFMQGAYEARVCSGESVPVAGDGAIDPDKPLGALALFVGGTMVRAGAFNAVRQFAALWDSENENAGKTDFRG